MIRRFAAMLAALAAMAAAGWAADDGHGTAAKRVVVLDWALAEQIIDLGIVPVGAPETDLYREWVVEPALPASVVDVGLRTEPNLERIADLTPDLILGSGLASDDVARLERVAPVLNFDAWSEDHDNVAASRDIFLKLARRFDRLDLAREKIATMEADLADKGAKLRSAFGGTVPPVAVTRLNNATSVWIYGENSLPRAALAAMGLSPALRPGRSKWGVVQKPIDALAEVDDGIVIAIRPHMAGAEVFESQLWQFMPFVRAGRFAEAAPVWSYGGYLSLGRHGSRFHAALMEQLAQ